MLFDLPETRSIIDSKAVVDEVFEFVLGKFIQIKDMFCLGKYTDGIVSSLSSFGQALYSLRLQASIS